VKGHRKKRQKDAASKEFGLRIRNLEHPSEGNLRDEPRGPERTAFIHQTVGCCQVMTWKKAAKKIRGGTVEARGGESVVMRRPDAGC